ncbi:MAG: hypothetical protein ACYC61_14135 [Isosphaeraceae bacterium]
MSTANKLKRVIRGTGPERTPAWIAPDRPSGAEPQIPAGEVPGQGVINLPAPVEPVSYEHRADLAVPTAADPDALRLLAEVRGPVAIAEALETIAVLDDIAKGLRDRLRGDEPAAGLIAQLRDLAARRGVYAARAQALGRLVAQPVETPDGPPAVPDLALRLLELPAGADLVGHLDALIRQAATELASIDARLDGVAAIAGSHHFAGQGMEPSRSHDGRSCWIRTAAAPDAWLGEASELTAQRREIQGRLDELVRDRDAAVNLVADGVRAAVLAAGGRDHVIGRLATAQALAGAAPADPPGLAEATELVHRLTEGGADESDINQATAQRQALLGQAVTDRAERISRRREMASRVLDAAVAGDETGRQAIEAILSKAPAVAPALLAAIREARADKRILALV